MTPADQPDPPPSSALVPKLPWLMRVGKWLQPRINDVVARSSKVGNPRVFDTTQFAWIAAIERNWETIRAEAAAALQDLEAVPPLAHVSPDHRRIAPAKKWRSLFLIGYGYRDPANCRACPRTTALVEKVPGLNSAFFSILLPRTRIPLHTGVTKTILTCHLGIQVPADGANCSLIVEGQPVHWHEGRAFVFDDCYNHEVRNDTDEVRIILLIQFRRPTRFPGNLLGELFLRGVRHSRFVQDARRGVAEWQEQRARP